MATKDTQVGQVVWYDLFTPDTAASAEFYSALTGWQTQSMDMGSRTYSMFVDGEEGIGGLEPKDGPGPGHWIGYVRVRSLAETLEKVNALGGTTVKEPTSTSPTSAYAIFKDPQGAVCGLYADEHDPGRGERPDVGRFTWSELGADGSDAAREFYLAVFNWELGEAMDMGPGGTYQLLRQGGGDWHIGGIYDKPPHVPSASWAHYITVPEMGPALEQVKELGGTPLFLPQSVGGGDHIVQCMDPQGCVFALHSRG